jgi:hypothetical protein
MDDSCLTLATPHLLAVLAMTPSPLQDAAARGGEAVTIRWTLWQPQPGTTEGKALAQRLDVAAVPLTQTSAARSAVGTRVHRSRRCIL